MLDLVAVQASHTHLKCSCKLLLACKRLLYRLQSCGPINRCSTCRGCLLTLQSSGLLCLLQPWLGADLLDPSTLCPFPAQVKHRHAQCSQHRCKQHLRLPIHTLYSGDALLSHAGDVSNAALAWSAQLCLFLPNHSICVISSPVLHSFRAHQRWKPYFALSTICTLPPCAGCPRSASGPPQRPPVCNELRFAAAAAHDHRRWPAVTPSPAPAAGLQCRGAAQAGVLQESECRPYCAHGRAGAPAGQWDLSWLPPGVLLLLLQAPHTWQALWLLQCHSRLIIQRLAGYTDCIAY